MERSELAGWLRLQATPGVGNVTARRLLAAFGLPESVFDQSALALGQVASEAQVRALQQSPPGWERQVERTCQWCAEDPLRRRVLTLGDADYPAALLQLDDPPLLLYAEGHPDVWSLGWLAQGAPRGLGMVGSRNASPQGARNARAFAQALAQAGVTIVSGLALGIDGAAHEGALQGAVSGSLPTIAVLGTGIDRVYPKTHQNLAERIATEALLLSEFALGTGPLTENFPRRNRIIAGLSRGTLVVEAALHSGSLITARLASEQGKDVFAIPGSIHSPLARGCHALIKQGAKLVETAQDVLEEWHWAPPQRPVRASDSTAGSALDADPLWQALGHDPTSLEALQARTGLDTPSLQARLMQWELEGHVARLPGGLVQRLTMA